MEILIVLFAIYTLACVCLGLTWILARHEDGFDRERVRFFQERDSILMQAEAERRDLYDRIQAGTLTQYKEQTDPPNNEIEEEEDTVVPLEDAREEIMNG